ncbi:unnamed protein product [Nippostrongylus brasiliensis]|uniref:SAM-dependent MTase TRM10-type domain-containing protein n=1 Tax=Nippostrongylus brasiliensis TaxID=27835 RepID=A0A0N4YW96_NIPBR|nr:unnamed protein product [Nippostrongylus brasiliensis]
MMMTITDESATSSTVEIVKHIRSTFQRYYIQSSTERPRGRRLFMGAGVSDCTPQWSVEPKSDLLVTHFDPKLLTIVDTSVSECGIRAILPHCSFDGWEKAV